MDAVITYVDGQDPLWLEDYSNFAHEQILAKRFRDWGTLPFLLRGMEKHLPYVKNVFLVVARESQVPSWIDRENVHIVLHKDIIPEEHLPTFNASMIEMFLHRIKGLDERYLYFNDDMFPIKDIPEEDFYVDGKGAMAFKKIFLHGSRFKKLVFRSDRMAREALEMKNAFYALQPQHTCSPMLRSECEKLYAQIEDRIMKSLSPTRAENNFNQYLFLDYMFYKGKAINRRLSNKHFSLGAAPIGKICRFLENPDKKLVCINDVSMSDEKYISSRKLLLETFGKILPEKSRFEK